MSAGSYVALSLWFASSGYIAGRRAGKVRFEPWLSACFLAHGEESVVEPMAYHDM